VLDGTWDAEDSWDSSRRRQVGGGGLTQSKAGILLNKISLREKQNALQNPPPAQDREKRSGVKSPFFHIRHLSIQHLPFFLPFFHHIPRNRVPTTFSLPSRFYPTLAKQHFLSLPSRNQVLIRVEHSKNIIFQLNIK